ncbi:N-acetylmuramoyl-L-alanine amidase family protein [Novosphingobium malaysiense]|uniref:N-acetylmuramoyl-L-alanine amidase n=1 Tax=Novosphingobium malaysiense TaxID=1348853 RepID=A0A0B1ZKV9_9SPHN|nr:N-acetylmuramoyl-L-alanine amidase [Novosphingobium malaysiense]KHK91176.1 N-acetylmuramoyl-L-alanine amidase [Novosphingobium malaysiense]
MLRMIRLLIVLSAPLALLVAAFVIDRAMSAAEGGEDYDYVVRFDLPNADAPVDLPRVDGPADASRPLVVIDPGHGGFDPGAGTDAVHEKNVALQMALAIREQLLAGGGIRVALTRDTDRFVSLKDRPDMARRLNADLFVSIHADSAENDLARGASVYVLSEKGSSQAAERFAARENGADRINGVSLSKTNENVGAILLELSQRGTQAESTELADLMLRELREENVGLHHDRIEMAALAVLKAPDIPSILFETGYINNPQDQAFLRSRQGQRIIAEATARAIRIYFARKRGV